MIRRSCTTRISLRLGLALLAGLAVFAQGSSFAGHRAEAAPNCNVARGLTPDSEESDMVARINAYRAQAGLGPLAVSSTLMASAAWKSVDLGANGYFAHDDLSRSWTQRIRDCGYADTPSVAENLAAGYQNAASTFDLWRSSSGHNANMLNPSWKAIGIARAYTAGSPFGWYWTANFGAMAPSSPSSASSISAVAPVDSATTAPPAPPPPPLGGAATAATATVPAAPAAAPALPAPAAAPPAPTSPTGAPAAPTTAPSAANLALNATAVVSGTGDCLRVHESPALASPVKSCLTDGTGMIIAGGPVTADGYIWWRLGALGWAVDAYLTAVGTP